MKKDTILEYSDIEPLQIPLAVEMADKRKKNAVSYRHRNTFSKSVKEKPRVKIPGFVRKLAFIRTGKKRELERVLFLPGTEAINFAYRVQHRASVLKLPKFSQLWVEDDLRPYLPGDAHSKLMMGFYGDIEQMKIVYKAAIFKLLLENHIQIVCGGTGVMFEGDWSFERLFMECCKEQSIPYYVLAHSVLNERIDTYGCPTLCYNNVDARRQGNGSKAIGNWRYELEDKAAFSDELYHSTVGQMIGDSKKDKVILVLSQPMYERFGRKAHEDYVHAVMTAVTKEFPESMVIVKQHPSDSSINIWEKHLRKGDLFLEHEDGVLHRLLSTSIDVAVATSSNALIDCLAYDVPAINIDYPGFPNIYADSKSMKTVTMDNLSKAVLEVLCHKLSMKDKKLMQSDVKRYFGMTDGKCRERAVQILRWHSDGS